MKKTWYKYSEEKPQSERQLCFLNEIKGNSNIALFDEKTSLWKYNGKNATYINGYKYFSQKHAWKHRTTNTQFLTRFQWLWKPCIFPPNRKYPSNISDYGASIRHFRFYRGIIIVCPMVWRAGKKCAHINNRE